MREYIFRGKRIDGGEWIEGLLTIDDFITPNDIERAYSIKEIPSNIGGSFGWVRVEPESVGQYTGMKDKNGRKIFEGDIVKLFLVDGVEVGIIKFNNIMSRFAFYDKSGGYGFDNTCVFEVIGTVFENADLLEE